MFVKPNNKNLQSDVFAFEEGYEWRNLMIKRTELEKVIEVKEELMLFLNLKSYQ